MLRNVGQMPRARGCLAHSTIFSKPCRTMRGGRPAINTSFSARAAGMCSIAMLSIAVTRVEMLEHTKKSCVAAAGLSLNNARKRHLDSFSCECGRPVQNKRLCGFVVLQSDQHMPFAYYQVDRDEWR